MTKPPKHPLRNLLVNATLMAVAFTLLGLAIRKNWDQVRDVLHRNPDWRLLGLAFGVYMVAILLTFVRWYWLVRVVEPTFRPGAAVLLGFIGNLFNLVINSDASTIHQVAFPANLQPCTATSCVVTSDQSAEQAAFARFMAATPKAATAAANKAKATPASLKGHKHIAKIPTGGLTADSADGKEQAAALRRVGMPVYYPRLIKAGSQYCMSTTGNCVGGGEPPDPYLHSFPREYIIRDQQGRPHVAYRMTLVLNSVLGEFYGVQGTTWSNPPLLRSPSGTRDVGGKHLLLYANGGRLTQVAWHNGKNVYWISNTLTSTIPNPQMVGMAASLALGH